MMIDDATLQNALDACPTPLYLFDQQVLNDRITRLRASLPSRIKLCYAMKANPFIVREASALADCVEACSPGEVLLRERRRAVREDCAFGRVEGSPLLGRSVPSGSHPP